MNTYMRITLGCYLLAALLLGSFGIIYLFRPEFMPYHAEAIGKGWSAVEPSFQVLILALMRVVGGACLSTTLAMVIMLFTAFREGARWAYWTIPTIGLMASIPALYATIYVKQNTPATPPWMVVGAGILVLMIGIGLSVRTKTGKNQT